MNEHLISVIIPVYNTAEYLPRCLDSILNNTYRKLEVICINDGSKDSSLEVLKGYAAKDSRVKVIDQENAGVSAARNHGLDEATGEYIAFVDSDDWVHRQYFEIMLCCALRHDADLTVCNAHYVSEYSKDLPLRFASDTSKTQTAAQMISGELPIWGKLYRAGFMGEVRFRPGIRLGEDILFNLEMLLLHWDPRLVQCGHTLYYYYSRPDSAVHTESNAKLEPLIDWYFSNLNRAPSREIRAICLEKAVKRLLSWRYSAMLAKDPEEQLVLKELCSRAKEHLRGSTELPPSKKAFLLTMTQSPHLYRLFRILNDPSLLKWEKLQRKKARVEEMQ